MEMSRKGVQVVTSCNSHSVTQTPAEWPVMRWVWGDGPAGVRRASGAFSVHSGGVLSRMRGDPLTGKALGFLDLRGGHLGGDDVAVLTSILFALR